MSYFRVFRSKCSILNKKPKSSKFAPKVYEGFLLGYGSNEYAYHVFNKTAGCVEIARDAMFDESNGSQVEQVDLYVEENEEPPYEAIKKLAIGKVRPVEAHHNKDGSIQEASTSLQGPATTPSRLPAQNAEVPQMFRVEEVLHICTEVPQAGQKIKWAQI